MLAVRPLTAGDIPAAVVIVRGLPDYFTDDVPGKVESDAAIHAGWVLADRQSRRHLRSRPPVDPVNAIHAQER
jgi:hypothetical protein